MSETKKMRNESEANRKSISNDQSKFLVCISASPTSKRIIRWTARTACAFRAKWIALYIETPETLKLGEKGAENLKENIELAKSLGGEFVQVEGYNIASSVSEYAKQSDITNIVIGKSRERRTIKNFFEKDLENQIISRLNNVEVHIIPDTIKPEKPDSHPKFKISAMDFLKMFAVLAAATAFCFLLKISGLSEINFILIYVLAVFAISLLTKGYAYGIISSLLGVLLFDFLFVEPNYAFHPIQKDYIVIFGTMFIVSVITGMLTVSVKAQSVNAVIREKRLENLYGLSQKMLKVRGYDNIINFITNYLTSMLRLKTTVYTKSESDYLKHGDNGLKESVSEDDKPLLEYAFVNKLPVGKFTKFYSQSDKYFIPVFSQENVFAVIGIDCSDKPRMSEEETTFLRMAASHFALALERQQLSDSQNEVLLSAEKEKMRGNLLRSVSHDLRTPLTSIYGSAAAVLDSGLDAQTTRTLIESIRDDSQWLIRMVENLLMVTRINQDGLKLKKQPEAVEEIIAEAVSRVKTRLKKDNIKVEVPAELLVVPMDGTLIEQVLINLMDNSVRHSESDKDIEIIAAKDEERNCAVITVSDYGKGLTDAEIEAIEKGGQTLSAMPSDYKKGMGIGLSICHSIIKAHGGTMKAGNRQGGGAEFVITLPMEEQ